MSGVLIETKIIGRNYEKDTNMFPSGQVTHKVLTIGNNSQKKCVAFFNLLQYL